MAIDKSKATEETFEQDDPKLVSNPNKPNSEQQTTGQEEQAKQTTMNSHDSTYQSPSHKHRKSVKVFTKTYELVEEIRFATKEKSNIDVYKKAVEYYAKHVLK